MCPPDEDHRAALGRPRRGRRAHPAPGDAPRARRAGPRAARADLPDPALRRHLAQPAARRPSRGATRTRASCASGSRRSGTGRRSTSRGPRPGSTSLFEPQIELYLREGFLKEKPLLGQLEPDVFPFVFSPARAAGGVRAVCGRVAARDRAGSARLLLHLVLQRLAGRPEPVQRAEAGRDRIHAAAGDGDRAAGALPRRVSGRDARLDRPRPARLVRVGAAGTARATRTSRSRSRSGGSRPRRRSPPASGTGEGVLVLTYEQLVGETEATLRRSRGARRDRLVAGARRPDVQRPADARELHRARTNRTGCCPSGRPPTVARSTKRRSRRSSTPPATSTSGRSPPPAFRPSRGERRSRPHRLPQGRHRAGSSSTCSASRAPGSAGWGRARGTRFGGSSTTTRSTSTRRR